MDNIILSLHQVISGYFERVPVVNDVSIDFHRFKATLLVGPNGAGKSTLLKTIYGNIPYVEGKIEFDGTDISALSPWKRRMFGIGFVMQGRSNFPYMSVKENLDLGAYKLSRKEAENANERTLDTFPILKKKLSTLAGNLSGGEQQILELAMILMFKPKLLLIDEPSLGLSPKWQNDVFENIRQIKETGITLILVEQNVRAGLTVADLAVVMQNGRIVHEIEAGELLHDESLKEAYLGSSAGSRNIDNR